MVGGTAFLTLCGVKQLPLQNVCVNCINDSAEVKRQPELLAVLVVPRTEQPVLICEHVVLYDAQEEPDVVLTH